MQYRKKPVVIEAWHAKQGVVLPEEVQIRPQTSDHSDDTCWQVYDYLHDTWVTFEWGDWIIKGVRGEFYPCKPDVFDATYEPVARADEDGYGHGV